MMPVDNLEYSAAVQLWLEAGEMCVPVAQVGESSLYLAECDDTPSISLPLFAKLLTIVDGTEVEYLIGIKRHSGRYVEFEHVIDSPNRDDAVPF